MAPLGLIVIASYLVWYSSKIKKGTARQRGDEICCPLIKLLTVHVSIIHCSFFIDTRDWLQIILDFKMILNEYSHIRIKDIPRTKCCSIKVKIEYGMVYKIYLFGNINVYKMH